MKNDKNELELEFQYYATLLTGIEQLEADIGMVTAQDIQAGILLVTRASDLLKKAKELSDKTQNLEIKEIIVELRSTLVDTKDLLVETKSEVVSLKEENDNLKAKIKVLEQSATNLDKPILRDELYYAQDGDGPFCTVCYDKNKEFIRVTTLTGPFTTFGNYRCQNCNATFG
jgi:cell division protein FtsB